MDRSQITLALGLLYLTVRVRTQQSRFGLSCVPGAGSLNSSVIEGVRRSRMASSEWKVRKFLNTIEENGRRIKNTLDNFKSELDLFGAKPARLDGIAMTADTSLPSEVEPEVMAMIDRKFFGDFLEKELSRCENYGYPLSIMRVQVCREDDADENCLRSVSETALQECTRSLQSCIRRSDKLTQLQDGEFFILLPETDETHSQYVLRRIGTRLKGANQSSSDAPLRFQIACASCNDQSQVQRTLAELLQSKPLAPEILPAKKM
jgi:GGDEF domain-containing protein